MSTDPSRTGRYLWQKRGKITGAQEIVVDTLRDAPMTSFTTSSGAVIAGVDLTGGILSPRIDS